MLTGLILPTLSAQDAPAYIEWSTYLGGTGFESYDGSFPDVQYHVDDNGELHLLATVAQANFPTTAGAFQPTFPGDRSAVLAKFDADGNLVYATYLGGSGFDDEFQIAVENGEVYIGGNTTSNDFPVTAGAAQSTSGGDKDFFLTKFDATGNVVYSTYWGGSQEDAWTYIAVENGEAYLIGATESPDFPVTAGAAQTTFGGGFSDVVLTKFDATGNVVYSTYWGGAVGGEYPFAGIEVENGEVYIGGNTTSNDFPVTAGAAQPTFGGYFDLFLTKFDATGSVVYSTYWGGSGEDRFPAQLLVENGEAYLGAGRVRSGNFPVTPGAIQTTYGGGSSGDYGIAKFDATGNVIYSTYLGGTRIEYYGDLNMAVENGELYITGGTSSKDFPITPGAAVMENGPSFSHTDYTLTKLDATGNLVYSTFLGARIGQFSPGQLVVENGQAIFYRRNSCR
jgi:hypothetical protein